MKKPKTKKMWQWVIKRGNARPESTITKYLVEANALNHWQRFLLSSEFDGYTALRKNYETLRFI